MIQGQRLLCDRNEITQIRLKSKSIHDPSAKVFPQKKHIYNFTEIGLRTQNAPIGSKQAKPNRPLFSFFVFILAHCTSSHTFKPLALSQNKKRNGIPAHDPGHQRRRY